mmetsp:Transcript_18706/g.47295  ORF Transcript_18706/g.47295 Transcript_18706/m.47295 type:complete len:306 (-) Transcript_18706:1215-2132(-)
MHNRRSTFVLPVIEETPDCDSRPDSPVVRNSGIDTCKQVTASHKDFLRRKSLRMRDSVGLKDSLVHQAPAPSPLLPSIHAYTQARSASFDSQGAKGRISLVNATSALPRQLSGSILLATHDKVVREKKQTKNRSGIPLNSPFFTARRRASLPGRLEMSVDRELAHRLVQCLPGHADDFAVSLSSVDRGKSNGLMRIKDEEKATVSIQDVEQPSFWEVYCKFSTFGHSRGHEKFDGAVERRKGLLFDRVHHALPENGGTARYGEAVVSLKSILGDLYPDEEKVGKVLIEEMSQAQRIIIESQSRHR